MGRSRDAPARPVFPGTNFSEVIRKKVIKKRGNKMKEGTITLILAALIAMVLGLWLGYDLGYTSGFGAAVEKVKEAKEILPSAKKEKISYKKMREAMEIALLEIEEERIRARKENDYLLSYFDRKEFNKIKIAAIRNVCHGDDFIILLAIRKAEGGGKGKEFGIKNPKAWNTDLDTQAGWAAATVVKNRQRWKDAGQPKPFIEYLGDRYCPPDAHELNKNWVPNVTYWYDTLKTKF